MLSYSSKDAAASFSSGDIGLTLLGHVPGIAYAWYIVYENRDELETHRHRHNGHTHAYVAVPAQQQPNYQATAAAAPPAQHPVN
ncbi:hypothetical protein EC968_000844 [Mortierella alpina]|nr:hypothetical protein EC968_000844 [Mortierella alpina]